MTIASIIKNREKKKKKTPDKPSFFDSPLWKRVEEHAKDWDNRGTAQRALKSIEKQKKEKAIDVEPAMEGVSNKQEESKPAKRLKRAKPEKPEKPKSEFLEKYYGKDWA